MHTCLDPISLSLKEICLIIASLDRLLSVFSANLSVFFQYFWPLHIYIVSTVACPNWRCGKPKQVYPFIPLSMSRSSEG
jgi:hypothetical protein